MPQDELPSHSELKREREDPLDMDADPLDMDRIKASLHKQEMFNCLT